MALVARGLGRKGQAAALLVSAGLGAALVVSEPVEQYTGGWWERDYRPTAEQVQAERERLGILPVRPPAKSSPAPAPRPTARPAPLPAAAPAALTWAAERLADEARFADQETALRLAQARQAAEARQAAALREEEDLAYVVAALAEGLGTPVTVLAPAAPATPEEDLAFVIAALAAIA